MNQSLSLASYGAWGKARPTSGSTAYEELAPGTFYSPTPAGQEEGFAGHDNLDDTGLVDMEGRIYDPEVGTFLSPDPNVQYPFSSQGYERYSYVGDNPLSLSDPSGYFSLSEAGIGQLLSDAGPFFNAIPVCAYWCTAAAEAVGGYMQSGNNLGAGLRAGVLSFGESYAFTYVGDDVSWGSGATGLLEKSFAEGIIGGAFSEAGGGNFGDGFTGAFVSSELSPVIGSIGGSTSNPEYYSASNVALRAVVSAVVGGTVAEMTGGNFGDAAFAAAMQRMFNDEVADAQMKAFERLQFSQIQGLDVNNETKFYMDAKGDIVYKTQSGCFGGDRCYLDNVPGATLAGHTHVYPLGITDSGMISFSMRVDELSRDMPGPGDAAPLEFYKRVGVLTQGGEHYIIEGTSTAAIIHYLGGGNSTFGMFVQSIWRPSMPNEWYIQETEDYLRNR